MMRLSATNQELVKGCQKGNNESFRLLFDKHSSWMMGVCLRYSKDQEDAQDILQDSLVKIFKAVKNFNFTSDAQFVSWLKTIIINTSLNHLRAQAKNIFISIDFESEKSASSHYNEDEALDEDEFEYSQEILMKYIQELPVGYKTVFNLYVFEDFTHKEISEQLNISENTSKTQLFKARNMLRNKITKSLKQIAL